MTSTLLSQKYQLTQEIRAAIMNARLNVLEIGATDGRNGSAEDTGRRVVTDDDGCGCRLCQQQYVADSTAGRSHQRRLRLSKVAGRPGGASSARAAEAGGADPKIGYPGIPDLSGRRQKAEDAETASAVHLQYDAGRIPLEMGSPAGLSDGGTKLCRAALRVCQKNRVGTRQRSPSGPSKELAPQASRRSLISERIFRPSRRRRRIWDL